MNDPAIPARWLDELFELLRIPSISADPARAGDIEAAAEWVASFVRSAGGRAELVPGASGRPLVVGEIAASTAASEAPTVLLYGHVDVQPAGDPALWDSDPFEPELRDGWIYGRGTADDKGNLYLLLRAAAELAGAGSLPVNVRVVCDAEEESGGNSIVRYLEADEGRADACIIFDSSMPQLDVPAFDVAARGIVYWHLTLRTGARDLHSGLFGGAALNAAHAMIEVLQAIAAVPDELREGEEPPSAAELSAWQALEPGGAVLAAQGARPLDVRAGEEFYVRTGARAAVDVNGIRVGEADLQKTVLPVEAVANVSIRLAPGQRAELIAERAERLLAAAAPEGAELTIARLAASDGALFATDSAAIELASTAFERVVGRRPLLVRVGGSLPILPALAGRGIPTIVTGFDLPDGNIHAPNERLLARYVPLGVEAAAATLEAFAALPRVTRR